MYFSSMLSSGIWIKHVDSGQLAFVILVRREGSMWIEVLKKVLSLYRHGLLLLYTCIHKH
jgi:hypothetical protein